jgi:hypothetical protein
MSSTICKAATEIDTKTTSVTSESTDSRCAAADGTTNSKAEPKSQQKIGMQIRNDDVKSDNNSDVLTQGVTVVQDQVHQDKSSKQTTIMEHHSTVTITTRSQHSARLSTRTDTAASQQSTSRNTRKLSRSEVSATTPSEGALRGIAVIAGAQRCANVWCGPDVATSRRLATILQQHVFSRARSGNQACRSLLDEVEMLLLSRHEAHADGGDNFGMDFWGVREEADGVVPIAQCASEAPDRASAVAILCSPEELQFSMACFQEYQMRMKIFVSHHRFFNQMHMGVVVHPLYPESPTHGVWMNDTMARILNIDSGNVTGTYQYQSSPEPSSGRNNSNSSFPFPLPLSQHTLAPRDRITCGWHLDNSRYRECFAAGSFSAQVVSITKYLLLKRDKHVSSPYMIQPLNRPLQPCMHSRTFVFSKGGTPLWNLATYQPLDVAPEDLDQWITDNIPTSQVSFP